MKWGQYYLFAMLIIAYNIVLVYSYLLYQSWCNVTLQFVAKLIAFLSFFGLSAPLMTILACLGAIMGTNYMHLWIKIKSTADSIWSQQGMWGGWKGRRYVSGDVCFSPPPYALCICFSDLGGGGQKTSYKCKSFIVAQMKFVQRKIGTN